MNRLLQPALAGVVTALVGFASSFTVVLAGLRAVGADQVQAASGLLALCVAVGGTAIWLSVRLRTPIAVAWSTPVRRCWSPPGPSRGFPAAVGAFAVCGLLIVVAGLFPVLGRWIAAIPAPIAGAMLAGVLLDLCVAPVRALVEVPELAVPVVLVWAALSRVARTWAVPGALLVAVAAIALTGPGLDAVDVRPVVELTAPSWSTPAMISIAVPLFLVTMAAQNVPGMAVLAGYGYRPPLRGLLVGTGLASAAAAPGRARGEPGRDHRRPGRRAGRRPRSGAEVDRLHHRGDLDDPPGGRGRARDGPGPALPPVLIEAVAGLALLGALASAVTAAVADPEGREAAVVTFAVTASGVTVLGVGAAFWGLVAGGLMTLLHRGRAPQAVPASGSDSAPDPGPASVPDPASVPGPAPIPGPVPGRNSGSGRDPDPGPDPNPERDRARA
nr:benzoate/H(+) symporter BenE family transporter [Planobispora longispora]